MNGFHAAQSALAQITNINIWMACRVVFVLYCCTCAGSRSSRSSIVRSSTVKTHCASCVPRPWPNASSSYMFLVAAQHWVSAAEQPSHAQWFNDMRNWLIRMKQLKTFFTASIYRADGFNQNRLNKLNIMLARWHIWSHCSVHARIAHMTK